MGEDGDDASSRGEEEASSFDAILQEIAWVPAREPPVAQVPDPETIAHFRIEGRLGQGAMGVVYRARDTSLQRTVALKVLASGFERDAGRRARFLREARAAAALNHPNLATVYEVGQADGQIYIAMEHVAGESLRQLLADRRPTVDETLRLARQIAAALAHAHVAGVIHRDLKPENVMVGAGGTVKVLDFGLAKLQQSGDGSNLDTETEAGQVMGTPAYMAPEQWRGSQVTAAADVFAFGVMLYEMLAGQRPFVGEGRLALARSIAAENPPPASRSNDAVTGDVDALVAHCLAKTEGERIGDGAALERRLSQLMSEPTQSSASALSTATGLRVFGGLLLLSGLAIAAAVGGAWLEAAKARSAQSVSSSHAAADAALAPSASVGTHVVTMINSPLPASVSAEALRHYQDGLADLRRCAMTVGRDQLARAVALDPTFAAARLRLAIWDTSPSELRDVARVRESLDARDQALLHATEPMAFEVPPNIPEVIRRLTELTAASPNDTELLFYQGTMQLETDAPLALATLAHVLELDPGMASAEDEMGWAALKNDQPEDAIQHFRRCVELSPGATSCFHHLAREEGRLGNCQAFAETARRGLVVEPDDYPSQLMWLSARMAGGAPEAEVLALVDDAVLSSASAQHLGGVERGVFVARRAVASWYGDFGAALRLGYEGIDAGRLAEESDLATRVAAMEELGRETEAVAAVRLYISTRASIGEQFDGVALRVLRERGDEVEMKRLRDEWLRAPRQSRRFYRKDVSPERDLADWLTYYGAPTLSIADAREALEAKERFVAIPLEALDPDDKEELGRIYLLAGKPGDAIAPLTQAAATCEPFEYNRMLSFIAPIVRARYELGLAEEALGDPAAACAAYASVLERWGQAKPRSKTADETRVRMKALACPVAPVTRR